PTKTMPLLRSGDGKVYAASFSGGHTSSTERPIAGVIALLISGLELYRGALASNIRAFDKALQMEIAMADRMKRMEELLISLGATAQAKRDSAASS
ncbi:MAG: hypothetical protein KKA76_12760, partial [Proteobacteria bacterium]|nr:hypothetical protein [Pseudomonadota bacterium]